MTGLLALLVGASSAVEPLADVIARGRPALRRAVLAAGGLAVVLAGLILALGPLGAGAPGLLACLLVPPAWIVWEALRGSRAADRRAALRVAARCGLAFAALVLIRLMGRWAPAGIAETATAWTGVLLFMTEPANRLVNAVLVLAGVPGATAGPDGGAGAPSDANGTSGTPLRGGHWIGALERILLVLLAMAGAEIPAAVIIAAKGVVRFPEISQPGGRAAEVFLIGSMASWILAVLGIAFLRAV